MKTKLNHQRKEKGKKAKENHQRKEKNKGKGEPQNDKMGKHIKKR